MPARAAYILIYYITRYKAIIKIVTPKGRRVGTPNSQLGRLVGIFTRPVIGFPANLLTFNWETIKRRRQWAPEKLYILVKKRGLLKAFLFAEC